MIGSKAMKTFGFDGFQWLQTIAFTIIGMVSHQSLTCKASSVAQAMFGSEQPLTRPPHLLTLPVLRSRTALYLPLCSILDTKGCLENVQKFIPIGEKVPYIASDDGDEMSLTSAW